MIALSSRANVNDIEQGRAAGFDDYLSKADQPRMPEALALAIDAAIHGRTTDSQWRSVS